MMMMVMMMMMMMIIMMMMIMMKVPALSQSLFFLGAIPGMIFFGWFADARGRMPAIVLSNVICLVSGTVTPFFPDSISFLVLRFVMGLAFNTFYTVPYILGEFTS